VAFAFWSYGCENPQGKIADFAKQMAVLSRQGNLYKTRSVLASARNPSTRNPHLLSLHFTFKQKKETS